MAAKLNRVGNWDGAGNVTSQVRAIIEEACIIATKRLALEGEKRAKLHISNQDLGWIALQPKTVADKARKGHSNLIYVSTSTYFQSITSWNDKTTAYIGVRRGTKTDQGGDLGIVAATLEFGSPSRNIPARPLWQPVSTELKEWCQKENDPAKIALDKLKRMV